MSSSWEGWRERRKKKIRGRERDGEGDRLVDRQTDRDMERDTSGAPLISANLICMMARTVRWDTVLFIIQTGVRSLQHELLNLGVFLSGDLFGRILALLVFWRSCFLMQSHRDPGKSCNRRQGCVCFPGHVSALSVHWTFFPLHFLILLMSVSSSSSYFSSSSSCSSSPTVKGVYSHNMIKWQGRMRQKQRKRDL